MNSDDDEKKDAVKKDERMQRRGIKIQIKKPRSELGNLPQYTVSSSLHLEFRRASIIRSGLPILRDESQRVRQKMMPP